MSGTQAQQRGTWFQRFLLPAFAMKGVIIGGGYATGRELTEYFLSQGPVGGLLAMLVATILWSVVAALTFAFAHVVGAYDYRTFMDRLLGRGAIIFELCYVLFSVLLLAVFGAAAGEIGQSLFGLPNVVGTLALAALIAVIAGLGESAVEMMFKFISPILYAVYAIFLILAISRFGDRIAESFAAGVVGPQWPVLGATYGIYNIVTAIMILPVLRHITSRRNAVIAGAIAGPLAMAPALAFTVAMVAFYPIILNETLPSDFLLQRINSPAFRIVFQLMVMGALLESGVGVIHALNERAANLYARRHDTAMPHRWFRPVTTICVLAACMFVANAIGLVTLIASGYRLMALIFLLSFVLPLLTIGSARIFRRNAATTPHDDMPRASLQPPR